MKILAGDMRVQLVHALVLMEANKRHKAEQLLHINCSASFPNTIKTAVVLTLL